MPCLHRCLCSPYDSPGSVLVFIMMVGAGATAACALLSCRLRAQSSLPRHRRPATGPPPPPSQFLIVCDMAISFRVAKYQDGELVTGKRELALDYIKSYFFIDLLSGAPAPDQLPWWRGTSRRGADRGAPAARAVLPLDEISLAIAGLNGPHWVNNPTLAYYLSLLRLVALVSGPPAGRRPRSRSHLQRRWRLPGLTCWVGHPAPLRCRALSAAAPPARPRSCAATGCSGSSPSSPTL